MQIHSLTLPSRKSKKRVGRGGKRGTTSGRGSKGQGAHNKHKDPLFEGGRSSLIERMKKLRGFKSPNAKPVTITFALLEDHFDAGEAVSRETIFKKKLYSPKHTTGGFKVVAGGKLTKKLAFASHIKFSEAARKAVLESGSTIEEEK